MEHPVHVLITEANSKCSGEPVHPRNPDRAFAVRTHSIGKQSKLQTKSSISEPS